MRSKWHRLTESVRNIAFVLSFVFSPGVVGAIVIFEAVYWTSPEWAQAVGFPTEAGNHARAIVRCEELLATTCTSDVVHDGGVPIPPEGLPEWTPIRIERRFPSGLAVVSSLGPHENFQYVVRDLTLAEGTIFRVVSGTIIHI